MYYVFSTLDRLRELELRAEELGRKAKSLETEKASLEKKLGETVEKRDKVKADLEGLGDF
jgi:predicted transcriptional regulator